MTVADVRLRRLHEGQARILREADRYNVVVCGRRFGKTTLGMDIVLDPPDGRGALTGGSVGWFAPDSARFDEVWNELKRTVRDLTLRVDSKQHTIYLVTGGKIDFWTMHNTDDPGRGRAYSHVVIDEAALVPTRRFRRQWDEAIRATLTDYAGSAWFFSTPKGANAFKDLYDRAVRGDPGWKAWQMPTTANPAIDPAEVDEARRDLPPLAFAQEYLAEFVTDRGAIFKRPLRYEPDELPKDGFDEATGCDFAYTSKAGDRTAFLRGRRAGDVLYLTDFYSVQEEANVWAQRLRLEPDPFAFIGGQEGGVVDLLRQFGIDVRTKKAVNDKRARAQAVAAAWNRGDVRIPTKAPWLDDFLPEVLSFTGDDKVDAHDDAIDALSSLHYALIGYRGPDVEDLRRASGLA